MGKGLSRPLVGANCKAICSVTGTASSRSKFFVLLLLPSWWCFNRAATAFSTSGRTSEGCVVVFLEATTFLVFFVLISAFLVTTFLWGGSALLLLVVVVFLFVFATVMVVCKNEEVCKKVKIDWFSTEVVSDRQTVCHVCSNTALYSCNYKTATNRLSINRQTRKRSRHRSKAFTDVYLLTAGCWHCCTAVDWQVRELYSPDSTVTVASYPSLLSTSLLPVTTRQTHHHNTARVINKSLSRFLCSYWARADLFPAVTEPKQKIRL